MTTDMNTGIFIRSFNSNKLRCSLNVRCFGKNVRWLIFCGVHKNFWKILKNSENSKNGFLLVFVVKLKCMSPAVDWSWLILKLKFFSIHFSRPQKNRDSPGRRILNFSSATRLKTPHPLVDMKRPWDWNSEFLSGDFYLQSFFSKKTH